MKKRVVLYFERLPIPPVTQVDFLFLPTTNLFEAFITNLLAYQNIMNFLGGDLTLHLCDEALGRPLRRNMDLKGIINTTTTLTEKVGPKQNQGTFTESDRKDKRDFSVLNSLGVRPTALYSNS